MLVNITVKQLVEIPSDSDDAIYNNWGINATPTWTYEAESEEDALDQFRAENHFGCLEDYEFFTEEIK